MRNKILLAIMVAVALTLLTLFIIAILNIFYV